MQRFVRNVFVCGGVAFILASGVYGQKPALAATTKPKPIVLKAVTFIPKTSTSLVNWHQMIKLVKERSDGALVLDYIGGPEAVPPPEQPVALQKGVVDLAITIPDFYWSLGPKDELLVLSRITVEQEMEHGGVYDFLQEYHRKAGFFCLGRNTTDPDRFFRVYSNKRVDKVQDFRGQKIAGMGMIHHAFMTALGGIPITLPAPDLYSAIERGVVDGICLPTVGIFFDQGFHETVKYVVDHTFFNDNTTILINLNSWNRIPKHLQDLLRKVHMETLIAKRDFIRELEAKQKPLMVKAGMKFLKFSQPDAVRYIETVYEAEWAKQLKKYPDVGPKLKELMKKR